MYCFKREELIEQIKALGMELQNKAEEMVPQTGNEDIYDYSISVDFDPTEAPHIDISFSKFDSERLNMLIERDKFNV